MSAPRIVVTRDRPEPALTPLREIGDVWTPPVARALHRDELIRAVAGADAVISVLNDRIDAEVLDAAGPGLGIVANTAAGFDNIDVAQLDHRGIVGTNTPGVLADTTAEFTVALMLAATRRIVEGDRLVRSGAPWHWDLDLLLGPGLTGRTVGIVGMGEIGRAVAALVSAFGCPVLYVSRKELSAPPPHARRVAFHHLLAMADVITLHCPLTPTTRHLIDRDALAAMKPTSVLINTSRGAVVDEVALVDALRRGEIAGAALDVFEREPEVHPGLRAMDSVVLAPHLGSATAATRHRMAALATADVVTALTGGAVAHPIGLHSRAPRRPG